MNPATLVLDTQALLWWLADSDRLGPAAVEAIDAATTAYASAASVWEVAIKRATGKLDAPDDLLDQLTAAGFTALPISWTHAHGVSELPLHHRDPFDRVLVAQARTEGATLVTADATLAAYDVALLRADQ